MRAKYSDHVYYRNSIAAQFPDFRSELNTAISADECTALCTEKGYNLPEYLIHEPIDFSAYSDREAAGFNKAVNWLIETEDGVSEKKWLLLMGNGIAAEQAAALIALALDEDQCISFNGGMKWIDCARDLYRMPSTARANYFENGKRYYRETSGVVFSGLQWITYSFDFAETISKELEQLRRDRERFVILTLNDSFAEFRNRLSKIAGENSSIPQALPKLIAEKCQAIIFNQ
jgi:hypothetical protein